MVADTRSRFNPKNTQLSLGSLLQLEYDGSVYARTPFFYNDGGIESVTSATNPGPPYKTGQDFLVRRKSIRRVPGPAGSRETSYGNPYENPKVIGNAFPAELSSSYYHLDSMEIDQDDLASYGATGISRFKPGKPLASSGQFLAELRDLPKIPLNLLQRLKNFQSLESEISSVVKAIKRDGTGNFAKDFAKKAKTELSGEFLNQVFGWVPFCADLIDMYNFQFKVDAALLHLRRNNGKWKKRGGNLLNIRESDTQWAPGTQPVYPDGTFNTNGYTGPGYGTETLVTLEKRYWFSGEFRYWIPPTTIYSNEWTKKAKSSLFGNDLTPSLAYQVIPWSWLVDWFTNVGDVIDNLSDPAVDNLVMRNCYVMGHTKKTTKVVQTYNRFSQTQIGYYDLGPAKTISVKTEEIKQRIVASPFGFGLQFPDLTPRQLSILAALGLSRR